MSSSEITEDEKVQAKHRLPSLFVLDSKNKERVWKTWSIGATMYAKYGLVDGKKTTSSRDFEGKNLTKKNATTPEEQTRQQCERAWVKRLDSGYKPKSKKGLKMYEKVYSVKKENDNTNMKASKSLSSERNADTTKKPKSGKEEVIENFTVSQDSYKQIFPMKCEIWSDEIKCTKYFDFDEGIITQPKLDGTRALIQHTEEGVAITTRTKKQYPWLKHIREEMALFFKGCEDIVFDGELYVHSPLNKDGEPMPQTSRFQLFLEICKPLRTSPHPLEEQLEYHIYDLVSDDLQKTRTKKLQKLFKRDVASQCPHIKLVKSKTIHTSEELQERTDHLISKGYEGLIARSHKAPYASKKGRSLYVRKIKRVTDKEFKVIGVDLKTGSDPKNFVFVCVMPSPKGDSTSRVKDENGKKKSFKVKPMGTDKERLKMYKNGDTFIGNLLTVEYNDVTKDGIPKFGRGKGFRDEADLD